MRGSSIVVVLSGVVVLAGLAGSCLRDTSYKCTTNDQCGADGVCEQSVGGYCSFIDSNCSSGRKFGTQAGSYAGQCVGGQGGGDGGIIDTPGTGSDGAGSDATTGIDAARRPSDFAKLTGAPATRYYKLITTTDNWVNQKTACTNAGTNTYLAFPETMAELQAMDTLAGGINQYWVGISDLQTAGTWLNVKGGTQTYLPWDGGGPSAGGTKDCVEALTQNTTIDNIACTGNLATICACE
jgi:hypothetical protein